VKILLGCDHRGLQAAEHLRDRLAGAGYDAALFTDDSDAHPTDYPIPAYEVAKRVAAHEADVGVLICGTGLGMSIAANKVRGVRAAAVHDEITAELSRAHLNANICCLSADLLGIRLIEKIVERFLNASFEGGRHERRLKRLAAIEAGRHPRESDDEADGDAT
jgi:ribose 5-phosphate isomerase B